MAPTLTDRQTPEADLYLLACLMLAQFILTLLGVAGLLLIAVGTLLPLLRVVSPVTRVLYSAGAVILLVSRIIRPSYKGKSLRVKRLMRIEFWSAIIFCAGAFFLWYPGAGPMDWLAFTIAGGFLEAYTSIMIPRTRAKEEV